MGVIMQTFYWDCPKLENQEFEWWNFVKLKLAKLSQTGFTAIWLPPFYKAANLGGPSMGYDPYDYYDLGEYDQKGFIKTWFGSKDELTALIIEAHNNKLDVYADLVFNHNSGADAQELNPISKQMGWTLFNPASQQFLRNWQHFHPSLYETTDGMVFDGMPDLCHRNPDVYTGLLEYARWLLEVICVDGFRYDFVKGYGGWMVRAIQELRGIKNEMAYRPFGVGECWDSNRVIQDWLGETNAWSDNPCTAFDFPLRYRLQELCDQYGYSLKNLVQPGALLWDAPKLAVTFVENHDIVRNSPIVNDKMLAYAFILTHEGYPCVFWQDYYNWQLAQPDNESGIDALVKIHEAYAGGGTDILYLDDVLYIMQRKGANGQKGLIFVLNNTASWRGAAVQTQWQNTKFTPMAWRGKDNTDMPEEKYTDGSGKVDFWAPPRGYTVYVPQ